MNGTKGISEKTASVLYLATGDARFYEAAGMDQPPDPRLLTINARWPELDEDAKKKIGDIANAYKQKK